MEDTYYFSQGRLAYSGTYNKFKDSKDIETGLDENATNAANGSTCTRASYSADAANASCRAIGTNAAFAYLSKLWNFQLYNKSILLYKL